MRLRLLAVAVVLCPVAAGCGTFFADAARNIFEAPVRSCDDCHLRMRLHHVAERAWDEVVAAHPERRSSHDFADGFVAGYADYLYRGGPPLPPAVPPFCYQLRWYETPQGHLAIEQWYAGFAEGAAAAQASGLRDTVVIPLSQPPINAVKRPDIVTPAPVAPPAAPPPADLPPPRVLDDAPAPEAAPPPG
jgi:hypothetical protein